MIKIANTEYTTFDDLWNDPDFLTPEEKKEIDAEVAHTGKIIEARELRKKLIEARELVGLTQQELADKSGVKQSTIAKLEKTGITPQINTLLRLLKPLGYTLDIIPIDKIRK